MSYRVGNMEEQKRYNVLKTLCEEFNEEDHSDDSDDSHEEEHHHHEHDIQKNPMTEKLLGIFAKTAYIYYLQVKVKRRWMRYVMIQKVRKYEEEKD